MSEKIELIQDEWWIELTGTIIRLGISEQLRADIGEIQEVVFPPLGAYIKEEEIICELSTEKLKSKLPSPVEGVVKAYNEEAMHDPDKLNSSNREDNWLLLMESEKELCVTDFIHE